MIKILNVFQKVISILQILIGTAILSITVLSMTAICTNGEVGSGGFYYMISRSLGPETGAMFGVLYFLTNAIMVAFSIVGVCQETNFIFQV
jgi:solute carrier family 12 sodium/potassium/chloride transporter 2